MQTKHLIILLTIAVIVGGFATVSSRRARPVKSDVAGTPLLDKLDLNAVSKVTITSPAVSSTLHRVDGRWCLAERHDYPIDFPRLRDALNELRNVTIGQVVPVGEVGRKELNMTPESATTLTLSNDAGESLATLWLGATRDGEAPPPMMGMGSMGPLPDGRFVSTDEGKTVYLIAETLSKLATTDPLQWIHKELLNVPGSNLRMIRMNGPERDETALLRSDDGAWSLVDAKPGESFDETKKYTIDGAINYLQLTDVAPPDSPEEKTGLNTPAVFEAHSVSGTLYTVRIGNIADPATKARYARVDVSFIGPPDGTNQVTLTEDLEQSLRSDAMRAHKRLSRWTYIIPSYKAEGMMTPREDLVTIPDNDASSEDDGGSPEASRDVPDDTPPSPANSGASETETASPNQDNPAPDSK